MGNLNWACYSHVENLDHEILFFWQSLLPKNVQPKGKCLIKREIMTGLENSVIASVHCWVSLTRLSWKTVKNEVLTQRGENSWEDSHTCSPTYLPTHLHMHPPPASQHHHCLPDDRHRGAPSGRPSFALPHLLKMRSLQFSPLFSSVVFLLPVSHLASKYDSTYYI